MLLLILAASAACPAMLLQSSEAWAAGGAVGISLLAVAAVVYKSGVMGAQLDTLVKTAATKADVKLIHTSLAADATAKVEAVKELLRQERTQMYVPKDICLGLHREVDHRLDRLEQH